MAREIDERKKRKALRKLRKAALLAEQGLGPPLSDWEAQFLAEVEARIETYGSAFGDPEKGASDEPLSALQALKLREIDKKARGKGRSGLKQRKPFGPPRKSYTKQRDETDGAADAPAPEPAKPKLVKARDLPGSSGPEQKRTKARPNLRLIKGGLEGGQD